MKLTTVCRVFLTALLLSSVSNARASTLYPVLLDFNGLDSFDFVGDFYSGGSSGSGTVGPDYGISMNPYAVFNIEGEGFAYTEANFSGTPNIHFDTPFSDGFAFEVRNESNGPEQELVVRAWDVDGVWIIDQSIMIPSNNDGGGDWREVSFAFAGAVDRVSIFSGNDYALAFDNMTFGSTTVIPLPAGAWLLLSALGALGITRRRRD